MTVNPLLGTESPGSLRDHATDMVQQTHLVLQRQSLEGLHSVHLLSEKREEQELWEGRTWGNFESGKLGELLGEGPGKTRSG